MACVAQGSKGKPLYQRLEEQARKAAAREEAEKRMKYEIELGSVRKQKVRTFPALSVELFPSMMRFNSDIVFSPVESQA